MTWSHTSKTNQNYFTLILFILRTAAIAATRGGSGGDDDNADDNDDVLCTVSADPSRRDVDGRWRADNGMQQATTERRRAFSTSQVERRR